jgi:hypothetical protein
LYDLIVKRSAEATHHRILRAGDTEFVQHGIAGHALMLANSGMIYVYPTQGR